MDNPAPCLARVQLPRQLIDCDFCTEVRSVSDADIRRYEMFMWTSYLAWSFGSNFKFLSGIERAVDPVSIRWPGQHTYETQALPADAALVHSLKLIQ